MGFFRKEEDKGTGRKMTISPWIKGGTSDKLQPAKRELWRRVMGD